MLNSCRGGHERLLLPIHFKMLLLPLLWHVLTVTCAHVSRLRVKFGDNYPLEPPEVVFLPPAPIHPHIYSNGHICLVRRLRLIGGALQ